jgi:class 3 adenylate cyclase
MGINLGDIVDDGEDIHGEGVNIAARIEALAEPGSISVSGGVFEQVRNRIEATFEDLGEHEVKHVSAPVRIYAIHLQSPSSSDASAPQKAMTQAFDLPSLSCRSITCPVTRSRNISRTG